MIGGYSPSFREGRPAHEQAAPGRLLLEDWPEAEPHVSNLFEQKHIAEEIEGTIRAFLSAKLDRAGFRKSPPLFIALHGRQGQGKSAAVAKIRKCFEDKPVRTRKWQSFATTRVFACSDYRASDLLENFDYFLHEGRMWRSIFLGLVTGAAGLYFLSLIAEKTLMEDRGNVSKHWLDILVSGALAGILASFQHLLRDAMRKFRTGGSISQIIANFLQRAFRRDEILIVDDLDRATPEQQKALLQALNRHRSQFSGVVLVAFDDAPLLEADGPRREGSELMTKIFDVSFRLSPMNASDAGNLAASLGYHLAELNPDCPVASLFREPIVCGGLARVFFLNGTASARFARKMVNSIYAEAVLANLQTTADLLARIRLSGIVHYLPVIETELDFLAKGLISSSTAEIFEEIEDRFGADLGKAKKNRLRILIEATRHMQPAILDWRRLLRIWRDDASKGGNFAPNSWKYEMSRDWARNEAYLAQVLQAKSRLNFYQYLWANPLCVISDEKSLTQQAAGNGVSDQPELKDAADYWKDMVSGLVAFDHEAHSLLNKEALEEVAQAHRRRPVPTLVFATDEASIAQSPTDLLLHALHDPINPDTRLRRELKLWKAQDRKGRLWPVPDGSKHLNETTISVIEDCWPSFTEYEVDSSHSGAWRMHFVELGRLLNRTPRDLSCLPEAHRDWIRSRARAGDFCALQMASTRMVVDLETNALILPRATITSLWSVLQGCRADDGFAQHLLAELQKPKGSLADLLMLTRVPGLVQNPTIATAALLLREIPAAILPDAEAADLPAPEWYYDLEDIAVCWPDVGNILGNWSNRWRPRR